MGTWCMIAIPTSHSAEMPHSEKDKTTCVDNGSFPQYARCAGSLGAAESSCQALLLLTECFVCRRLPLDQQVVYLIPGISSSKAECTTCLLKLGCEGAVALCQPSRGPIKRMLRPKRLLNAFGLYRSSPWHDCAQGIHQRPLRPWAVVLLSELYEVCELGDFLVALPWASLGLSFQSQEAWKPQPALATPQPTSPDSEGKRLQLSHFHWSKQACVQQGFFDCTWTPGAAGMERRYVHDVCK